MFARARLKLAVWYVVFLAAILLVFDGAVALLTAGSLQANLSDDLQHKAQQAAAAVVSAAGSTALERSALGSDPGWNEVSLYTTSVSGTTVEQNPMGRTVLPDTPALEAAMRGQGSGLSSVGTGTHSFLVYTEPVYVHSALGGQRLIGVVQVARSTRPLVDAMGRVVLYLALGSLAAILFAFGAGLWLADKALDPIRRNVASQKRFVSDASHELRTPVTIIQTAAEAILRSRETVPPRVQRLAADISNESQQLGRLVADLGVLAQAGTRQAQMQMEEVSVDQLLENALASARLLARPFDVRLESKISAYGHVLGDAARLHQLLGILVDNAVRHSDRGAAVTFEAEAEARHLVLRVRDHGPGIPEDELPHIFERFYRGSRDRQVEGSGLGLAIARWIVEEHRGQISVRSAAAVGSEFTVVLPLLPAERRVPLTRAVEAGGEPASQIE